VVDVLERTIHDLDRDKAQTVVDEVGRHVCEHDESRSQPQPPDHTFHPRSPGSDLARYLISSRALASLMFSPLTRIVPPWVPFFLPAADSVPEILMVWVGAP